MRVLLTGATGFIGRHVLAALLDRGHAVVALQRSDAAPRLPAAAVMPYDIDSNRPLPRSALEVDAVIHLAWPGLPRYRDLFHFEQNLPASYRFLKMLVQAGVKQVVVAGTCLEYGMRNGALSEDLSGDPVVPYAVAKDALRRFLVGLQGQHAFRLRWVRLFYLYGPGQRQDSLHAQLEKALASGVASFDMSPGDQLRDYLPVEEAGRRLAVLAEQSDLDGIFNCCSGKPISVARFAEQIVVRAGGRLTLNRGVYPYPEYEPLAFWGSVTKTAKIFARGEPGAAKVTEEGVGP